MSNMAPLPRHDAITMAIDTAAASLTAGEKAWIDMADEGGAYVLTAASWQWNAIRGGVWTPAMEAYRAALRARRERRNAGQWPLDRSAGNYRSQYRWIIARGD